MCMCTVCIHLQFLDVQLWQTSNVTIIFVSTTVTVQLQLPICPSVNASMPAGDHRKLFDHDSKCLSSPYRAIAGH